MLSSRAAVSCSPMGFRNLASSLIDFAPGKGPDTFVIISEQSRWLVIWRDCNHLILEQVVVLVVKGEGDIAL
jgi:hypothetical protein